MRWVVLVALLVAGCKSKPAARCEPDSYELERYLRGIDLSPRLFVGDVTLVEGDALPRLERASANLVEIHADTLRFRADEVSPEELGERLVRERAFGTNSDDVLFAVDAAAPWRLVAVATRVAHEAGLGRASFAFVHTPAIDPPPPSVIDDELERLGKAGTATRATELAKLLERLVADCPSLVKLFGKLAAVPGNKGAYLVNEVGPAIRACGCRVDLPSIRNALYHMLANNQPNSAKALVLDPAAPSIKLAANVPWREAHVHLLKAQSAWLEVTE